MKNGKLFFISSAEETVLVVIEHPIATVLPGYSVKIWVRLNNSRPSREVKECWSKLTSLGGVLEQTVEGTELWISNYIRHKVWDKIIYVFATVAVEV